METLKYLTGLKGTLVQKKKKDAEKAQTQAVATANGNGNGHWQGSAPGGGVTYNAPPVQQPQMSYGNAAPDQVNISAPRPYVQQLGRSFSGQG